MLRRLFIPGVPKPQGSKKHIGNGRMVESSKGLKVWRKTVHRAALAQVAEDGLGILDGPIHLHIKFYMPRPKHHPKTKMTYPITMPDLSKLIRAVEDSLTTARWWADDARVIRISAEEWYSIPEEYTLLAGYDGYACRPGVVIETETIG